MKKNLILIAFSLVSALLAVPGPSWCQTEKTPSTFEASLDSYLEGNLSQACRQWSELVTAASPESDAALFLLAENLKFCLVESVCQSLTKASGQDLPARSAWRLDHMKRICQGTHPLLRAALTPVSETWRSVPLSSWEAYVLPPEVLVKMAPSPGFGQASRGIRVSRYVSTFENPTTLDVDVVLPNPGVVYLDGEAVLTIDAGRFARGHRDGYSRWALDRGCHEWIAVEMVQEPTRTVEIRLLSDAPWEENGTQCDPPSEAVPVSLALHCGDPEGAQRWACLALQGTEGMNFEALVADARSNPRDALFLVTALNSNRNATNRRRDMLFEALSGDPDRETPCLLRQRLARWHLRGGELEGAYSLLEDDSSHCEDSPEWTLLRVDLAEQRGWGAQVRELLEEGARRFPDSCELGRKWSDWNLAHGRKLPQDPPARCAVLQRESKEEGSWKEPPHLADVVDIDSKSRRSLLEATVEWKEDRQWSQFLGWWTRHDVSVAWDLVDLFLSRDRLDESAKWLEKARLHVGTWESVRMQAGRRSSWAPVEKYLQNPLKVIGDYEASGFAPDEAQVLVFDEGVLVPDEAGWATLVETNVTLLRTPTAVEGVGELEFPADREVWIVGVRKADGKWVTPGGEDGLVKETVSLPGLAPGDYLVIRTVKELHRSAGTPECSLWPTFYFGHRSLPVFEVRYTVWNPRDLPLESYTRNLPPGVTKDGTTVWSASRLQPIPLEPYCADGEVDLGVIQVYSRCFNWELMRNMAVNDVISVCNAPAPGWVLEAAQNGPDAVFRSVLANIQPANETITAQSYHDILQNRRGNLVTALYCSLVQADFQARFLLMNSQEALPFDVARITPSYFDSAVVRVTTEDGVHWYDPFDSAALPNELRRPLQGRRGLVLEPHYPFVFLTTPTIRESGGYFVELSGKVDDGGKLTGEMRVQAKGNASIEFGKAFRGAGDKHRERVLQSIVYNFVAGARMVDGTVETEPGQVTARIPFELDLVQGKKSGVLLLQLLPTPPWKLGNMGTRHHPLYLAGLTPSSVKVDLHFADSWLVATVAQSETYRSVLGEVAYSIKVDDGHVRVRKRTYAPASNVAPSDYLQFQQLLGILKRTYPLRLELERHDDDEGNH